MFSANWGVKLTAIASAKLGFDFACRNLQLNGSSSGSPVDSISTSELVLKEIPARPDRKTPKYPIVLCHGFSGFDKLSIVPSMSDLQSLIEKKQIDNEVESENDSGLYVEYWTGVQKALRSSNKDTVVFVARVPPLETIKVRANALNDFITKKVSSLKSKTQEPIKINLVAHSMGGLDCRYLISKLEKQNYKVASLTTISTPHRGCEVADFIVNMVENVTPRSTQNHIDKLNLKTQRMQLLPPSVYELTTSYCKKFNNEIIDDPKVKYFSYGARFEPHWYDSYALTWKIVKDAGGGDNDGLISVKSAKWGKYMGTIEGADHLDLVNWKISVTKFFKEHIFGVKDKFNAIEMYLNIADDLAREGF